MDKRIKRGQVWWYKPTNAPAGHIQRGARPVIIVSNDKANEYSPVVLGIPCTTQIKRNFPTHVTFIMNGKVSTAMADQIISINKNELISLYFCLESYIFERVEVALKYSLGLESVPDHICTEDFLSRRGIVKEVDENTHVVSVKSVDKVSRNAWTDNRIEEFCSNHDKMPLKKLTEIYHISSSTAEMYYRKFTRGGNKDASSKSESAS